MANCNSYGEIKTFAFLDLEATSLPSSNPRITELSIQAIHRHNLMQAAPNFTPRVIDKLTICVYPMKSIDPEASVITGLYNDNLYSAKDLDDDFVTMVAVFLKRLDHPLVLVAHNGFKFDFPLLISELHGVDRALDDRILCVDSLIMFKALESEAADVVNGTGSLVADITGPGIHHEKETEVICEKPPQDAKMTSHRQCISLVGVSNRTPEKPPCDLELLGRVKRRLFDDAQETTLTQDTYEVSKYTSTMKGDVNSHHRDSAPKKRCCVLSDVVALSPTAAHDKPSVATDVASGIPGSESCSVVSSLDSQKTEIYALDDNIVVKSVDEGVLPSEDKSNNDFVSTSSHRDRQVGSRSLQVEKSEVIDIVNASLQRDQVKKITTETVHVEDDDRNDRAKCPPGAGINVTDVEEVKSACQSDQADGDRLPTSISNDDDATTTTTSVCVPEHDSQTDAPVSWTIPSKILTAETISKTPIPVPVERRDRRDGGRKKDEAAAADSSPQKDGHPSLLDQTANDWNSFVIGSLGDDELVSAVEVATQQYFDGQIAGSNTASGIPGQGSSQRPTEVPSGSRRGDPGTRRVSHKLGDLHRRVLGLEPPASHSAEGDAAALVRIFNKTASVALPWADKHAVPISDIAMMYHPKKRRPLPRGTFPYQT